MKGTPKARKYGRGIIRPMASGAFMAEVNHCYRRFRKTFKTDAEARGYIDGTTVDVLNMESPLDAFGVREARRAKAMLPDDVTLTQAVEAYIRQYRGVTPALLDEAIKQFIAEKTASGRRPRTVGQYRQHLNRLCAEFGERHVHEMDVLDWVNAQGVVGQTRTNLRASLHTFFAWAMKMNYAARNPAEAIGISRVDETLPGILSVSQSGALLQAAAAVAPDMVPTIAVGLFAGIRAAELMRMTSKAIGAEHIHVGPEVAKLRHQRYVTVSENLAAWLEAYPPPKSGYLCPLREKAATRAMRQIRVAAGIIPWPHNAMRHTFATFHLALHRNAPLTSHEMGHADVEMLYRHYRHLATCEEAEKFFDITPASVSDSSYFCQTA